MNFGAVIVGAGKGERLNGEIPKCLLEIDSIPLILMAAFPFDKCRRIKSIAVVVPTGYEDYIQKKAREYGFTKIDSVVAGGLFRPDSVQAGISSFREEIDRVLIHDGARPLLPVSSVEQCLDSLARNEVITIARSVSDTLHANKDGIAFAGPDRKELVAVQTPQGFDLQLLREAFAMSSSGSIVYTDEVALVRDMLSIKAQIVLSESPNIKITYPGDLDFYAPQLRKRVAEMKEGID